MQMKRTIRNSQEIMFLDEFSLVGLRLLTEITHTRDCEKLFDSFSHSMATIPALVCIFAVDKAGTKNGSNTLFNSRKMKFFIDTANLAEIREANDLGVLDGVTTNPSLMAKEGITGKENILNHYVTICNIVDGDVSAEVIATDFEGMVREGEELAALHKNIVVKIPMTPNGIKAIKYFSGKGIRTNCTLIFSAGQALLAAKAGATYISPFLGRLDDISVNGIDLIAQIRLIYDNYAFDTEILAASVRHPMHIIQCAEIGADVMTGPLKAIMALAKHPLTDSGLETFLADYAKGNQ